MNRRGLQHPIEVLPLNNGVYTIVAGHSRVQAATLLGWPEINATIRQDLADAGAEAIEEHLISDNINRRQMTPLAMARCALRIQELYHGGRFDDLDDAPNDVYHHVRDRVGHLLGVSGRQVSRLLSVLECPVTIQQAFDLRQINADEASRVAAASEDVRAQIVCEIEAGGKPKDVIRDNLINKREPTKQEKAYARLLRAHREAQEVFANDFDTLRLIAPIPNPEQIITDGIALLEELQDHLANRRQEQAAARGHLLDDISELMNSPHRA